MNRTLAITIISALTLMFFGLLLTLMVSVVSANPFLTSSPSEDNAPYFKLKINGVETEKLPTESYKIWYDLWEIPVGRNEIQAVFGIMENGTLVWGDWAPRPKPAILYRKENVAKGKFVKFSDGWYVRRRANMEFTLYYKHDRRKTEKYHLEFER